MMLPPLWKFVQIALDDSVKGDFVDLLDLGSSSGDPQPDDRVRCATYLIREEPTTFEFDTARDDFAIKGHATRSKDLVAVINAAIAETTSQRTM